MSHLGRLSTESQLPRFLSPTGVKTDMGSRGTLPAMRRRTSPPNGIARTVASRQGGTERIHRCPLASNPSRHTSPTSKNGGVKAKARSYSTRRFVTCAPVGASKNLNFPERRKASLPIAKSACSQLIWGQALFIFWRGSSLSRLRLTSGRSVDEPEGPRAATSGAYRGVDWVRA